VRRLPAQRTARRLLAALAMAAVAASVGSGTVQAVAETRLTAGPPYDFTRALIDGRQVGKPLTGVAVIDRTAHGYVYRAGSQDNRLTVTRVKRGLRFADPATPRFKSLARECRNVPARRGVAAVCPVPGGISEQQPLLVEVWPRIGDDHLDTSTLPVTFAVTMLGDLGDDVANFGPGPDFFNGHTGRDRVRGGGGDDWVRAGDDDDLVFGGPGNDYLVGMLGDDVIRGGDGDDQLAGMDGDDLLHAGAGRDRTACGSGTDTAWVDTDDFSRDCESVQPH
jgi:serralysin